MIGTLLKKAFGAVAALAIGTWSVPEAFAAPLPGGTLDPTTIPKYVQPLVIPPAMPRTTTLPGGMGNKRISYYEIAVRQFEQQILPGTLPMTTVWSYGSILDPGSFNYPAFTIEARWEAPVRVKWINDLKDPVTGQFLPHLLPIDQTLHWANPPGGGAGRDMRPMFMSTPGPYTGPVPIVTHLHGGHSTQESDGFPEAWYLPDASNVPFAFATAGRFYDENKARFEAAWGQVWEPGTAVFQYQNDQNATTLWYHDHTLGMTRANVYAGPAGFYLLRGGPSDLPSGVLPGPAPALGDPPGVAYYEIPIAIQDRSFNADGSLFYPSSREFFDGFAGPYYPGTKKFPSDISPIWNPEFFGNTMVVNGRTWPYLDVEQHRYRFRFLDGSNSRFLILTTDYGLPFWQIGSDGGFLDTPVQLDRLLLGPAERADVIVDFTDVPIGTIITLVNIGPDEPFGGGEPVFDFPLSDPDTTGQVMQFRVVASTSVDTSTPPSQLVLPFIAPLPAATHTRQVSLNELDSALVCLDANGAPVPCESPKATDPFGPLMALLGTVNPDGSGNPIAWDGPITENPALNSTEIWELFNFTEDAHPIHIHDVQFEIVDRQPFGGAARPPEIWETGQKDTVIAFPGEITRVKATYDQAGLFVWHCHILEHEDNEMMRPYRIGP